MNSATNNQPTLRRVKKFASSSVLDSNYSNAGAPPTPNPTQSTLRTLANITNHPLNHTRSRSQSQSQFEGPKFPVHSHQAQRFARKAQSQAALHDKQHATIESLISNPPASLVEALQDLRYLILTEGVTADMDGNVRPTPTCRSQEMRRLIIITIALVPSSDIYLVYSPWCDTNADKRLCLSRSSGSVK